MGLTVFMDNIPPKSKPEPGSGGGGGAIAKAELCDTAQPIESLNPHQNRWAIEARIT
jgi:hypothetical protein